jgi:hypothetical protein
VTTSPPPPPSPLPSTDAGQTRQLHAGSLSPARGAGVPGAAALLDHVVPGRGGLPHSILASALRQRAAADHPPRFQDECAPAGKAPWHAAAAEAGDPVAQFNLGAAAAAWAVPDTVPTAARVARCWLSGRRPPQRTSSQLGSTGRGPAASARPSRSTRKRRRGATRQQCIARG